MYTTRPRLAWLTLALGAALGELAHAQCFDWSTEFGSSGVDDSVSAQVVFDDGSGPALYVAGEFQTAGSVVSPTLAKWNGQRWSAVDARVTYAPNQNVATIKALAVFDDGSGPALYAGGQFDSIGGVSAHNVAKWSAGTWAPLGTGTGFTVNAFALYDDGAGEQLYVGCDAATTFGALTNTALARWDGASWTYAGSNVLGRVFALAAYDDGGGSALFVGGITLIVAPLGAKNLLEWDGASWSDVGGGANHAVYSLATHDDGGGPALFVGGQFTSVGGGTPATSVAKWNGSTWSALGNGTGGYVYALASYDDGAGAMLYAGGYVTSLQGISRWNGTTWLPLGNPAGLFGAPTNTSTQRALSLAVFDDASGAGPALFVGGLFARASATRADNIARWSSSGWSALGAGQSTDDRVEKFAVCDSGAGPELYMAGVFEQAGATRTGVVAKWNGSGWSDIGASSYVYPSYAEVHALETFDDGSGPALYVGGLFASFAGVNTGAIVRWNGTQWSAVGSGLNPVRTVSAMAPYDDGSGPALYASHTYDPFGGTPDTRMSKWDGYAWSALPEHPEGNVLDMLAFDDRMGAGTQLYAVGTFTHCGATTTLRVARWNGSVWSPVGTGFNYVADSLAVYDDGSGAGPELYAGGSFWKSGAASIASIARWDGSAWQPLGTGMVGPALPTVTDLAVFDDGAGSALFATGGFSLAGGVAVRNFAKWNGSSWSDVAGGLDVPPYTLASFDDGSPAGPKLWLGGTFKVAGSVGSQHVAVLERRCPCPPVAYCTAGTSTNGCTPAISGSGTPSASSTGGFALDVTGVEGQRIGYLFYGVSGRVATPWGAGTSTLCVAAPRQRMGNQLTGGTGGACDGVLTIDWNGYVAAHPTALGAPFSAGQSVDAQGWYRDPPAPKTTNLTSALEFVVCP